jgi:2-phospho-L-lactate guanylyltransferase
VTVTAIVPIRSFAGLTRLSHVLDRGERVSLMRQLSAHTVSTIHRANLQVLIVSNDSAVVSWSKECGYRAASEPDGGGLNEAAAAGAEAVDGPWMVLHADLPAIGPDDVRAAVQALENGHVLAPAHDGGTSLIGGRGSRFPFRYGPGSFRRHLAAINGVATILIRPGLALDLDRPWDLAALRRLGYL